MLPERVLEYDFMGNRTLYLTEGNRY